MLKELLQKSRQAFLRYMELIVDLKATTSTFHPRRNPRSSIPRKPSENSASAASPEAKTMVDGFASRSDNEILRCKISARHQISQGSFSSTWTAKQNVSSMG